VFFRTTSTDRLSPAELDSQREQLHVIDIREPGEWAAGRIEGTEHIPMAELLGNPGRLPTDRPLALVCRSGSRSRYAAQQLAGRGFEVTDLEGGIIAWARAGLPVDANPSRVTR
jgi:rhodanese-related sulfurtransferase